MILLDTNVLIYAGDATSPFFAWASGVIADAASGEGCCINPVVLAELRVGEGSDDLMLRLQLWGVEMVQLPVEASEACARAYATYRHRRRTESGRDSPAMPLPDFFIGAHAQLMGWTVATADPERFQTYFPSVPLLCP